MNSPLVLIVDDELPIRRFLRAALTAADYRVAEAETAHQAIRIATQQPPDLVILDLGLPDKDGQELLVQLREWLKAPIIVLSARNEEHQKVLALDHGADDYLTKPFSTEELMARMRVAMRHLNRLKQGSDEESATFIRGDLRVDLAMRKVFVRDQETHLTPIEYKLLTTLVRHSGKVLTHKFLLNEVWGPEHASESHYVRVFMTHLRRKIEADPAQPRYLITEQGVGYRFSDE